jgi:hypothetical protein
MRTVLRRYKVLAALEYRTTNPLTSCQHKVMPTRRFRCCVFPRVQQTGVWRHAVEHKYTDVSMEPAAYVTRRDGSFLGN